MTRKRFRWRESLGDPACPYMIRWSVDLGRFGSVRLHHWLRGDDARAMHDHPSDFVTLVLMGSYENVTDAGAEVMTPGTVRFRRAEHTHTVRTSGCWTLVHFRPRRRAWGFWHANKSGRMRWWKSNKWHAAFGPVPCDDVS